MRAQRGLSLVIALAWASSACLSVPERGLVSGDDTAARGASVPTDTAALMDVTAAPEAPPHPAGLADVTGTPDAAVASSDGTSSRTIDSQPAPDASGADAPTDVPVSPPPCNPPCEAPYPHCVFFEEYGGSHCVSCVTDADCVPGTSGKCVDHTCHWDEPWEPACWMDTDCPSSLGAPGWESIVPGVELACDYPGTGQCYDLHGRCDDILVFCLQQAPCRQAEVGSVYDLFPGPSMSGGVGLCGCEPGDTEGPWAASAVCPPGTGCHDMSDLGPVFEDPPGVCVDDDLWSLLSGE